MLHIESYLQQLISALQMAFGPRLLYVGLQGSYLRGEATDCSDIDIMLVLDSLSLQDMDRYRSILIDLGHYDLACGFICSREDLLHWNALELCHLLHTTKDCFGCLAELLPAYDMDSVRQYAKLSLNNLYHELCHRYIHKGREQSLASLPQTCKAVFFILQSLQFLRSGVYVQTKRELLALLDDPDRQVLETAMTIQHGSDDTLMLLFDWCQRSLRQL